MVAEDRLIHYQLVGLTGLERRKVRSLSGGQKRRLDLALGLIGSAFPFTIYFWLLRHQSATNLSMINYATPILALIVGSLVMSEAFPPRILAGSALVLVGVAVAVTKSGKKATQRVLVEERSP